MKLSIIIPARREEDAIISTLKQLEREVHVPHEILVVDDAIDPADRTADVVAAYAKRHPDVILVRKKSTYRDGFAVALSRGIQYARGDAVVFVMADICDDPKTINTMYKKLLEGYDVVCGSRYMPGGKKTGGPVMQNMLSRFLNRFLYLSTGVPTRDATNAFKMYRRSLARSLVFDTTLGFAISMHIFFQAFFSGARIAEIPTRWVGRKAGASKFRPLSQMMPYARATLAALAEVWKRKVRSLWI